MIDDALPASIEIVFDEMLDAGSVPKYVPELWIRFMVRVCRENPFLPVEFRDTIDLSERYYIDGESDLRGAIDRARAATWEWEVHHRKTASPYSLYGDPQSAAAYQSVRGLICLLYPDQMTFDGSPDLEETLSYFVPSLLAATHELAPDFRFRMTEILTVSMKSTGFVYEQASNRDTVV